MSSAFSQTFFISNQDIKVVSDEKNGFCDDFLDLLMHFTFTLYRDIHVILSDKSSGRRTTHKSRWWTGGILLRRIHFSHRQRAVQEPETRRAIMKKNVDDPYFLGCNLSAFRRISSFMWTILILRPAHLLLTRVDVVELEVFWKYL